MGDDYLYLGEVKLLPYNFAPKNLMLCDGRLLDIASNRALYSLLGVKFGGDSMTTFALPDLRGAEPIKDMNYYMAYEGSFPIRN